MRIGQSFYALPQNQRYAIFLDAATLGELGTATLPPAVNAEAYADLLAIPYTLRHQVLIVLAGPDFTPRQALRRGRRHRDLQRGASRGDGTSAPRAPGQLTGWLQPSIPLDSPTPAYRLVQPDRAPIETSAAATATSNTIAVGAARTTRASCRPARAPASRCSCSIPPCARSSARQPPSRPTARDAAAQQAALAALLKSAAATTAATVVVQSIGRPRPTAVGSVAAAQQIERLGGSEWIFLGLDGSGGYAPIGITPPLGAAPRTTSRRPRPVAQWTDGGDYAQRPAATPPRRRLVRGADATRSAPTGSTSASSRSPSSSRRSGLSRARAEQAGARLDRPASSTCRRTAARSAPRAARRTCARSTATPRSMRDPSALKDEIADLAYAPTRAFAAADLATEQDGCATELDEVAAVWNALAAMQQPFALTDGATAIAANAVAADVMESVERRREAPVSADLGLTSAILYVVADVPEVGEAFGPVASILDLASVLTEEDDEPSPDREIRDRRRRQAGAAVDRRLTAAYEAIGSYGAILVSDAGKLAACLQSGAGAVGAEPVAGRRRSWRRCGSACANGCSPRSRRRRTASCGSPAPNPATARTRRRVRPQQRARLLAPVRQG